MCDGRSPSCSKCLEAETPCVASGASKERTAPRSIVQYLENELDETRAPHPDAACDASIGKTLADQVMDYMIPPFLGLTSAVPLARCAVAGTRLPSTRTPAETVDPNDERRAQPVLDSSSNNQPVSGLSAIPTTVADFLLENYMTRIVAQYPIFYSADIMAHFNSVFHNKHSSLRLGVSATSRDIYVISLIMAISLTTAARTQQVRANSIATSLLKEAMQHMPSVCTNDIAGLQALLLLLEYTTMDPTAANIWLLSGFATQACIDQGLHQEGFVSQSMDSITKDIRRRVFWCTYELEIATSAALLRPTAFFNISIDVPFPAQVEDNSISSSGIDLDGHVTKFASWRIWQFRQIEAEILSVLFHNGQIPSPHLSLGWWMDAIEAKINGWNREVHQSASLNTDPRNAFQWEEMCLYADIARDYIIVTLFRPSPQIEEPPRENLMKAFTAGIGVADGYWRQSNLGFGNSKYVFHPCYHTFSAAIVFLRALQRCKDTISAMYTLDEIENFIACFSRLFTTIAERWPAASRCLEEFERLMVPVKREYIDHTIQAARNVSQSSSYGQIPAFGETDEMALCSAWQLDSIDLEPLLVSELLDHEGSGLSFAVTTHWNAESDLSFSVPIDWNAEFNFGMD
ncbi:hypothetical protein FSARC_14432 [Fusarium sarcochroum]|uniref:Xylanolytic transcriptional activator regulatory domain-containing protein n=1 Tax=Fusarium sarcochroum TaxID=1208366 RepID=A0A8H4WPM4_9HYPO|nr:hypothetical protein FSARC_14432 [Fusarium sarcochroum]